MFAEDDAFSELIPQGTMVPPKSLRADRARMLAQNNPLAQSSSKDWDTSGRLCRTPPAPSRPTVLWNNNVTLLRASCIGSRIPTRFVIPPTSIYIHIMAMDCLWHRWSWDILFPRDLTKPSRPVGSISSARANSGQSWRITWPPR